ncbi:MULTISPECIES: ECF transporter S component [Oceanobacillus]|uniref:ECF transporter S component n=1 Tax=Oceanobacillus kimchii TaxID=746691 RepID=A0ABQ5THX1_9BACI|nr:MULTISPECIES: ECF transporter S component [Oceanobacillus]MBT2598432.1 ECF transporter S component [Oceanobacillus sp. ISL-74]MBT2651350.1 ECF transporter S component [Oceanobacillus sp. ISL-73]MCT1576009.1 ECF transporter S component [Oceanobacillus kimchii]MCT2135646.1 ECF transporter S component [Oceanobacillus kimchii]OEH55746.1 metal ABC transporter permease [Oceanobacillus sp. E9]
MNTYKLTLLAILSALAVGGRYAFQFLPNVQPVTAIIIVCGVLLGPLSSIIVGLLTTFLSNMLLGMGIWTIWQMISWCMIGLISGLIGKYVTKIPLWFIVTFGIFSGYLYGFVISLTTYQVTGYFIPYYIAGLPFDTAHAIGNGIFLLLLYPIVKQLLKEYNDNHFPTKP